MGKAGAMRARGWRRNGIAIGGLLSLAGCVEPAYVTPGPIPLQGYPPPVSYRSVPGYPPALSGPIPLQPAPAVQPLPPPTPAPTATEVPPADDGGAIPVQDMPPPVADTTAPAVVPDQPATPAPPATQAFKAPTSGPGSNVPLEGFRPMRGQARPTP